MRGVAGQEVEGVGELREDSLEGIGGAGGGAREVEDEGGAERPAETAAESGEGRALGRVLADELGEAGNEALADGEGGFGGEVAGGEPSAAGGEHQRGASGGVAEGFGEARELVGEREVVEDQRAGCGEEAGDSRAGEVDLRAGVASVADRDDDGGAAGEAGGSGHGCKDRRGGGAGGCRTRDVWASCGVRRGVLTPKDEKIEKPAVFGSGIQLRRRRGRNLRCS
jgi:hypothetical protein